jgi:transposase
LLRELKKVDGTNASTDWKEFSKKAKRLFGDALRLYHREGYDPQLYQSRIDRLDERLIDLMLIQSADEDVTRIAARLEKYWDELLVFLTHPGVPPTNNQAEREICPAVIMRKMIQGNQSETGAKTQSILMTIFRTLKRRGYNPVPTVVDALQTAIRTGQLPPLPPPMLSNGS